MEGQMTAAGKMRVGYFTQYQVEELDGDETPLEHMTRRMKGANPGAVRAQLGRFGFSGAREPTEVSRLSVGQRARLAMALLTRRAPPTRCMDTTTNYHHNPARKATSTTV